ncbi:hypothetical protein RHGRI_024784 [Rhododendron griersonianum]|uniref:Flotillin-like n=1 Tax=Rhododendron griersonianum TaxID=479676 RepID=A0AAV6J8G3_9ERIC|nr:hypothetical protein RHGRI_024784 [Rhododendron griersonianum]
MFETPNYVAKDGTKITITRRSRKFIAESQNTTTSTSTGWKLYEYCLVKTQDTLIVMSATPEEIEKMGKEMHMEEVPNIGTEFGMYLQKDQAEAALTETEIAVPKGQVPKDKVQEANWELYKKQKEAEAVLFKQQKEAEAKKATADAAFYTQKQVADGALYAKQKEAEGIISIAEAQGLYLKCLLKEVNGNYAALRDYMMINNGVFQEIAKINAEAVKGLQPKISVWSGANGGGESGAVSGMNDNTLKSFSFGMQIDENLSENRKYGKQRWCREKCLQVMLHMRHNSTDYVPAPSVL